MIPTRPCASIAALSSSAMLSSFVDFHASAIASGFAISCVLDSTTVSMMRSRLARSDDPVSVTSTIASARIGGFTSVAPHENSTLTLTLQPLEVGLRRAHQLGRDRRPFEILRRLVARVLGHGEHPADLAEALLRVDEIRQRDHAARPAGRRLVLRDPVEPGQPGVEDAVARRSAPSPARGSACTRCRDRRCSGSRSAARRRC